MTGRYTVQLTTDTNYIPVQYLIVEILPASTTAGTEVVLQVIRVGWDTNTNYTNWINTGAPNATGMQGTLGAFSVETLDAIVEYGNPTQSVFIEGTHGFYPTAQDAVIDITAQTVLSTNSMTMSGIKGSLTYSATIAPATQTQTVASTGTA